MIKIQSDNPESLAKRMMWLAYQAADVFGMGAFQARGGIEEDQVWHNVTISGDYAGSLNTSPGLVFADYVFGRMMKLDIRIFGSHIEVQDREARSDYQSWAAEYPTFEALAKAAVMDLETEPAK